MGKTCCRQAGSGFLKKEKLLINEKLSADEGTRTPTPCGTRS